MGSKQKLVDESYGGGDDRWEETFRELHPDPERSLKELYRTKEDHGLQVESRELSNAQKLMLISKLEESRQSEAARKQLARKVAWRDEVRKEVETREEFQREMESGSLEKVEGEDKSRMFRMSLEWRESFRNERAVILFPKVFPELLQCPSYRATADLLGYRLLCKSIKNSIDELLPGKEEEGPSLRLLRSPLGTQYFIHQTPAGLSVVKGLQEGSAFARKFTPGKHPFFSRSISIKATEPSGGSPLASSSPAIEFWKRVQHILQRWGEGVSSVSIEFSREMSHELAYGLLVLYLKLMPNLVRLCLSVKNESVPDNFAKLKERIARNPLPEMAHLQVLQTEDFVLRPVTHALLSRISATVKTIRLHWKMRPSGDPVGVFQPLSNSPPPAPPEGSFSSLTDLSLKYFVEDLAEMMNIFRNLNDWGKAMPLKRLDLSIGSDTKLELDNKVLDGLFLELPQLEQLKLGLVYINFKTLGFLLPCKALKTLAICSIRMGEEVKTTSVIGDDDEDQDELLFQVPDPSEPDDTMAYGSRIWRLLPELGQFMVERVTKKRPSNGIQLVEVLWTREGYLQYLQGGP